MIYSWKMIMEQVVTHSGFILEWQILRRIKLTDLILLILWNLTLLTQVEWNLYSIHRKKQKRIIWDGIEME